MDVFIRDEYRNIFIESIKFCQKEKGLQVGAWCLMTSHAHLIIGTNGEMKLEGIIRDLKSYPIEMNSNDKIDSRLAYIHQNPVEAGFVEGARDWKYSSAKDYQGEKGLLDMMFLD